MRKHRKTRRSKHRNRRTRKHSGGDERSNAHEKLMLNISEEKYPTNLALIRKQIEILEDERKFTLFNNHKKLIDKEINDLFELGKKIREEKTGILSLKERRTRLHYLTNLDESQILDKSQIAELEKIEENIKKIEKENEKRRINYQTTIKLYEARKKLQPATTIDTEWRIPTRSRSNGITTKSTVH
jgi:hypothetical protein